MCPLLAADFFLLLCLQLDSSSFFHDLAPGVENDGTGIIVALAAAKALGAAKRNVGYFRFADLVAGNHQIFIVLTQHCEPSREKVNRKNWEGGVLKWTLFKCFLYNPKIYILTGCWQVFDAAWENSNGLLKGFINGCHQANGAAVRMILPSWSYVHLIFSFKDVQFKKICMLVKANCLPAENLIETLGYLQWTSIPI